MLDLFANDADVGNVNSWIYRPRFLAKTNRTYQINNTFSAAIIFEHSLFWQHEYCATLKFWKFL